MYLNLDLLYNIYFFLKIRVYKRDQEFLYTYNNNFYQKLWRDNGTNKVDYKKFIQSYFFKNDLHYDILEAEYAEIEPLKIPKNLYYALITF